MPKTTPFEIYGDRYDAWFVRNHELYQAELEAIRGMMPPGRSRGLEVGVGSGKFAVPLGVPMGVEPALPMGLKAAAAGIRVAGGVAERLPFVADCFDWILMVTTICFVDDIRASFREAFRVLKPGGVIILGFVDRESTLGRTYREKQHRSVFYREATFYSVPEVCRHLADAGFGGFRFRQTLFPGENPRVIRDGFGEGGFVVIRAVSGVRPVTNAGSCLADRSRLRRGSAEHSESAAQVSDGFCGSRSGEFGMRKKKE